MTELFQAMWDDVEKDMSVVHPEMLKIFEPQMRRTEIEFNLNLLSVVYFLEKNPEKINLTLPMTAWPPGWAECVYYDGIEHICTDESALNELLLDDSFKKLYEERAAAKREVDAVKNKDEFKEAADLIYKALLHHKNAKEAENFSQKTIKDLDCAQFD